MGVPSAAVLEVIVIDTRFERVTFVSDALPLRQSVEGTSEGRGRGTFAGSVNAPGAAAGWDAKAGGAAAPRRPFVQFR